MPQNDFLPFAVDPAAAVLSQSSYASGTPQLGRGPGIVPKEQYNKTLRQGTAMAAAIGGFITSQGFDARDDGNIDGLTESFRDALDEFFGGSARLATGNLNTNGHLRLPISATQAVIVQWGYLPVSGGNFSFDIPFPTICFIVVAGNADRQGGNVDNAYAYPVDAATFYAATKGSGGNDNSNYPIYYLAIGH